MYVSVSGEIESADEQEGEEQDPHSGENDLARWAINSAPIGEALY